MANSLLNTLKSEIPGLVLRENEPLSRHTSFRIGGDARLFAEPSGAGELASLVSLLRRCGERYILIGNGTNMLFSDDGYNGCVIHLGDRFAEVSADGDSITALSGITLSRLAVFARDRSLSGLEFAHGIPGSLGGAVFMNAGAYGGEMKDVISSVSVLTPAGDVKSISGAGCAFSYRTSRFEDSGEIILGAVLRLAPGDSDEITAAMRLLMEKRASSQPLDKPSAGSTFKRPQAGYAAAMIDECGLKGLTIGGAAVSDKHAGFVVNLGGASFSDVISVMDKVRDAVYSRFGVTLEPEVRIIRG